MNFGIMSIRHPYRFFKWAICRITHTPKTLYITFDDGPDPNTTEKVLKILKEFNVKATFFCTGQNAENCEYLIQKILKKDTLSEIMDIIILTQIKQNLKYGLKMS